MVSHRRARRPWLWLAVAAVALVPLLATAIAADVIFRVPEVLVNQVLLHSIIRYERKLGGGLCLAVDSRLPADDDDDDDDTIGNKMRNVILYIHMCKRRLIT